MCMTRLLTVRVRMSRVRTRVLEGLGIAIMPPVLRSKAPGA